MTHEPRGWYQPRGLPHFDGPVLQSVTFRTADSIPRQQLGHIQESIRELSDDTRTREQIRLIENELDSLHGGRELERPEIAAEVERVLLAGNGIRYQLHTWVVMPTHVHVLFRPVNMALAEILRRWKGGSARAINEQLGHSGKFWAKDYFDRAIRDHEHFERVFEYIEYNPVKAGLCQRPEDWPFGSAGTERGRCGIVDVVD